MPSPRHALLTSLMPLAFAGDAFATADAIPATPATSGSYIWELMAILLPLAFIIICLLVLLRFLRRRFGLSGHDAPLSVVQVLPVGPRERIVVVRSRAGRAFAVGVSANAVTLVSELDSEDLAAVATEPDTGASSAPVITTVQR
ncbi:MAG: flagellar biosynthetic protein FliO [Luteimonas sp.]|nr:flagellar biosynthetic protein FliO [Luteimonas sp.]